VKLFSRDIVTLNIEVAEARVLIVNRGRILRWDSIALPAGMLRNGQVAQPAELGRALDELFGRCQAARQSVVVGLNGQRSLVRIFNLPPVDAKLLDDTIRREARRELPLPLDELYLTWQLLPAGISSTTRPVFVLGIPRETIDTCLTGLRAAQVRAGAMDLKPLALARAVNVPDVLIADAEAATQDVIVVRGGIPIIVRSIGLPQPVRPPADQADALATEIQRTLDFYQSSMAAGRPPWTPVVCLTGLAGEDEGVRQQIGARWPLVQPAPALELPVDLPGGLYLTNIGLALKKA
jgi:Tfp pilus assembly PilM family ATPase